MQATDDGQAAHQAPTGEAEEFGGQVAGGVVVGDDPGFLIAKAAQQHLSQSHGDADDAAEEDEGDKMIAGHGGDEERQQEAHAGLDDADERDGGQRLMGGEQRLIGNGNDVAGGGDNGELIDPERGLVAVLGDGEHVGEEPQTGGFAQQDQHHGKGSMQQQRGFENAVELEEIAAAEFVGEMALRAGGHGAVEECHEAHDADNDTVETEIHHPERRQDEAARKQGKQCGDHHPGIQCRHVEDDFMGTGHEVVERAEDWRGFE